jgi:hypothetical protein
MNENLEDTNFLDYGDGTILVEDGLYDGTISGYRVKFEHNSQDYEFETKTNGHRGTHPVKISIKDCKARVYLAK